MVKPQAYLDRIGFSGAPRADLATLRALHRAHVEAIPYENLDVQLGRPVTRAIGPTYEKIVTRRRGGWCYEMNGLLSWALEEIGFKVTRLAGGVARAIAGDAVVGNHLVLLVDLGETWLADAGFGDGLIEPTPLREGAFRVGPLDCRLDRVEAGWWRYSNDPTAVAPSFDFHEDVFEETLLEDRCRFLQTNPASPFVQNAVVQRWLNDAHYSMRGRVLQTNDGKGKRTAIIKDAKHYVATLREVFALDLPEAASLWPKICARHETVFGSTETSRN
ncbi:MAG: arylamine N-acetyltransferase [Parvularculaceae bacterium]